MTEKSSCFTICSDALHMRRIIEPLRKNGKQLVTTNGCFDLLHAGHVRYLCEAAQRGDLLVVGVNSDETVRKLKGAQRPVQNEKDRVLVVGSLKMVFGAFIFREDDPRAFLEVLKPDIHIKGGDYDRDILERETVEKNGGKVEIVSYLEGYSTTSIVSRIRSE
ncbi:MAG: adenylyltransferase/cytidyltransferase family protein [Chitinispirillaceae bacterium]